MAASAIALIPTTPADAACTGYPTMAGTDYVLSMAGTPTITSQANAATVVGANGIAGMVAYETTANALKFCDGTTWQTVSTGAGGTPAGADREIQFNNAGAFGSNSAFKLMSDGDLLLTGTYTGTASVPATGAGTRMFFDTQKAAIRAGNVTGTQWDNANIGNYSTAFGQNSKASGSISTALGESTTADNFGATAMGSLTAASGGYSTAMGRGTAASGSYSTAMGFNTTAFGDYSTAIGKSTSALGLSSFASGNATVASGVRSITMGDEVTAGDGSVGSGYGDGSMAIGLIDDAVTITTKSKVTGIQSLGIFMGDQDGLVVTANNQMSLLGGKMLIDPAVPATTLAASHTMQVVGAARFGGTLVVGRSGTDYDSVGYNFQTTGTSGTYNYVVGDTSSRLEFASGGFKLFTAPSGTAGAAITYSCGSNFAQGGTSWAACSDVRLKQNIQDYNVLSRLNGFRAVSFDWKDRRKHDVGVVAQEVYKAFPEIVDKGNGPDKPIAADGKGTWYVQYDKLGALSMQGVKELYGVVKQLKADNDNLRELVERQGHEIEQLKTRHQD